MMALAEAVDVFASGFCLTRSFTHPYVVEKIGPLIVFKDGPGRKGRPRGQEIIAHGISVDQTMEIIRANDLSQHALCVIHNFEQDADQIKDAVKAHGFRLRGTEPLMVCDPAQARHFESNWVVKRVETLEDANLVAKAARTRQALPEHLECDSPPLRLYAAFDGNTPVGWVRSIPVGAAAWVSNLYVQQEFRRMGIGRALMSTMLADDTAHGVKTSVLLASHTGAKLYPSLGYQQIGLLQLFLPR